MNNYPINIVNLPQKRCIVVGGGRVAARKVAGLIAAGARPVVISPSLHPALETKLAAEQFEHASRRYHPDDLEGVFLVIAATDDPELNRQIWEQGCREGTLVNVVDCPERCHFFAPAILRRGNFVISISTGGTAPALASHTRRELERRYGPEYETITNWCESIRPRMPDLIPDSDERKARWVALVNSPVLSLLSGGEISKARAWFDKILGARQDDKAPLEPEKDYHAK